MQPHPLLLVKQVDQVAIAAGSDAPRITRVGQSDDVEVSRNSCMAVALGLTTAQRAAQGASKYTPLWSDTGFRCRPKAGR